MKRTIGILGAAAAVLALAAVPADAQNKSKRKSKPPVPFSEDIMASADRIDNGKEIWQDQCAHCHGAKAYPGKAPKLKPRKYKPGFVYRRITDGFRKMPAWDEVYDDDERMNITVYIMSDKFSP